jgi:hypothetical protein
MKKPDQNENNLKDALFKRIESEQVCPKSRFFFLCRECSVWLFWVLSVVVGAMAVAVSLFVVMNRQYAFYEATHDNWLTFMVEALPYLWFLVFGLMAYFATFNIRHTVRGYRYPAWLIVGSSVAMSVVVGVLLQTSDLGHVVDNALGTHMKMYMSQEKMEQKLWQAPAEGRLLGQRVFEDTVPSTTVVFVDVDGGRTSDLDLVTSVFMYDAVNILPQDQAKLKTSLWRRTADTAIPARAKVNGAYVNSALAKQDAIDAGFDDCLFLNQNGYVSELSAANIFMIKRGELITPDCASDILEGITRRSIIELAEQKGMKICERKVALTEMYTADEVFACGTSAFVSPIVNIDGRIISDGTSGKYTNDLRQQLADAQADRTSEWTTLL